MGRSLRLYFRIRLQIKYDKGKPPLFISSYIHRRKKKKKKKSAEFYICAIDLMGNIIRF